MDLYFRIDVNIVAAAVLVFVSIIAYHRLDRTDQLNRLFLFTSLIIFIQLLIEAGTCLINGQPGAWVKPLSMVLHMGLFITSPILTLFWYLMIRRMILPNLKVTRGQWVLILIPLFFNLIICFVTPFLGWIFYLDDANVYHRGILWFGAMAFTYVYILLSIIMVVHNRNKIMKEEIGLMLLSTVLPIIGAVIQSAFYGALAMWSTVAFALIIFYLFLQQRLIHLDKLTGAWNRESFDYYISQRLRTSPNSHFGAIYFDLDQLKEINDRYGHLEGDEALKAACKIIKSVLRPRDIIARLGGDEFMVIVESDSRETVQNVSVRISQAFFEYNQTNTKPYHLETSSGADLYNEEFSSFTQFFHHVDKLMYENKNDKKSEKDQIEDSFISDKDA
jgi:diguanylate cyclase (GGDEF)-like protein